MPDRRKGLTRMNKKKLKEFSIVLAVWVPLLFIIIGGIAWKNDRFDGTIMEELFPALFFGIIGAGLTILLLSNIFRHARTLWWILGGVIVLVAVVIMYMCHAQTALLVTGGVIGGCTVLMLIIKSIAGR